MEYEFVIFNNDLPVKIIFHPVDDTRFIPRHWHESVEISYVLSGSIEKIYIEGTNYTSKQGDIVVINSNDVHSFSVDPQEEDSAITIILSYEFLKSNFSDIDRVRFQCISSIETDEQRLVKIGKLRDTLNAIVAVYKDHDDIDPLIPIKIRALSYELVYLLIRDFAVEKDHVWAIKSHKYLGLLTEITEFIKDNYRQQLSIDLIANQFGFTTQYLCRFFRKQIGMTILQYIHTIRLEKGHHDLVTTDHPITQIAYENGFPNIKSFNRVFRSMYTVTPNQYRKSKRL